MRFVRSRTTAARPKKFHPEIEALEARELLSAVPMAPQVRALHSKPDAQAKLYLDFDGFQAPPAGSWQRAAFHWAGVVQTPVFDFDRNPASFSDKETDAIAEIWARVAEDYAPFNLDVTTEEPA